MRGLHLNLVIPTSGLYGSLELFFVYESLLL
jgi:hypothetical protein